jgi:microcystin-dependent protein
MEPFLGEIKLFGGNYAPVNWDFCAGQQLSIADNPDLYAVIGTTYGGDGSVHFMLPDLRGRVALGTGQGPGLSTVQSGQVGGQESVELSVENLPSHTHVATLVNNQFDRLRLGKSNGVRSVPQDGDIPSASSNVNIYGPNDYNTAEGQYVNTFEGATIGNTGGSETFSIREPYLGLNYIICINGPIPQRK